MIRQCKERRKLQNDSETSGLGDEWSLWAKGVVMNSGGLCTFEEEM